MDKHYDYLVIGSGPAGHTSAIVAAQHGLNVAVVEKDDKMFGGVCLNEGCIPAKSLYRSAKIIDTVRRSPELCGMQVQTGCVDMPAIVRKSREHAETLRKGLLFLFSKNGIELIKGSAAFSGSGSVKVALTDGGTLSVNADKILIATGSVPRALTGVPFDGSVVLDSSGGIRLESVPGKMLIVGGGAIGTEFASFYNIIGSDVTIVEMENALLPTEDREVTGRLEALLVKRGVKVNCSSRVKKAVVSKGSAEVVIEGPDGERAEVFDKIIVSVGRAPATAALGLENAGIAADEKGFIPVDGTMRTSASGIYAAGDAIKTPMLAHVASAEGEIAAESAAGKDPLPIDYDAVPNAMYGDIQVASVGMTEETAEKNGIDHRIGKQFFRANGRAVVNSQTEGFIKVIADAKTHKFLGVHIIGYEAAELIHEFVLAKRMGLTVDDVAGTIHAHPTFSETAIDACRAVFGKAVHG